MSKLMKYIVIEWKLLFRGVLLWALLLAIAGLFYLTTLSEYRIHDLGWHVSGLLYLYLSPLYLIVQFLSVALARRDETSGALAIHASLPYRSWQVICARLLAIIIPFSLFALIPAGYYLMSGLLQGYAWGTLASGVAILCTYVVPVIFTVVLSYWIGTWTKKRIVYLISFATTLLLIIFARLLLGYILPTHWLNIVDMGLTDLSSLRFYSELWGFTVDETFWLHRIMYICITVIILACMVWMQVKRRHERKGRTVLLSLVGVAAISLIITITSYGSLWNERLVAFEEQVSFYEQDLERNNPMRTQRLFIEQFLEGEEQTEPDDTEGMSIDQVHDLFRANHILGNPLTQSFKYDLLQGQYYESLRALSYDMDVNIVSDHQLEVQAKLLVTHDHEQPFERLPMSLRHVFHVSEVKADGQDVHFEWEANKEVLWIEPATPLQAGDELTLDITYSGEMNDWFYRMTPDASKDHWERRVFVDEDKLFLPAFYGWYPQPGYQRLAEFEKIYYSSNQRTERQAREIRENASTQSPADFQVNITTDHSMAIVSNGNEVSYSKANGKHRYEFSANGSDGLHLFGGDVYKWTAAEGDTTLSFILSAQVKSDTAETITGDLLHYYKELANIVRTLDPSLHLAPELTIVRADYPDTMDFRRPDESINSLPQDGVLSSTFYMPYMTHPSRLVHPSELKRLIEEMADDYLFATSDYSVEGTYYKRYVLNMISHYIERSISPVGNDLFDPTERLSGGSYDPIHEAINTVYASVGHDYFITIIRQVHDHLAHVEENIRVDFEKRDQAFIDFIHSLAGDAS